MTAQAHPDSLDPGRPATESETTRLPFSLPPWAVVLVRVALILIIFGELYVTATVQLPGLMHPTDLGTDTSNYYAAGQRLNAGHDLYGPLLPTDRPVPGYPKLYPAPILSPPLSAVMWRPLATLGDVSMTIWWAVDLALVVILAVWFAVVGRRWTLGGLAVILALGLPIAWVLAIRYRYLGYHSPISIAALSGNLNGFITGLCVLAWWASSRGRPWLAGAAAGFAAMLKLGPFALVWWLVVRRDWPAVKAFAATVVVLGIVGLVGAGFDANLAFARLTLSAGVSPSSLSVAWILHTRLGLDPHLANLGTMVATIVGLALVYATRRQARVSFLLTILVVIYCSPVVLVGNFALLLAAVAPWVVPDKIGTPDRIGAVAGRERAPARDMATRRGTAAGDPSTAAVDRGTRASTWS
jgi:Glycosyltransferase family 87